MLRRYSLCERRVAMAGARGDGQHTERVTGAEIIRARTTARNLAKVPQREPEPRRDP